MCHKRPVHETVVVLVEVHKESGSRQVSHLCWGARNALAACAPVDKKKFRKLGFPWRSVFEAFLPAMQVGVFTGRRAKRCIVPIGRHPRPPADTARRRRPAAEMQP